MALWTITNEEIALSKKCISIAKEYGASAARITLNKSLMDLFRSLNGELDKVTHAGDRSMTFSLFTEGRFGVFSINKLDENSIREFIIKAINTVKMLAPDEFRVLPDISRTVKNAVTGLEAGLFDEEYTSISPETRLDIIKKASFFALAKNGNYDDCKIISEETEYSDSIYDSFIVDSNGLECRHTETSFEIGCETTIADNKGNKFSGYWWDSAPFIKKLSIQGCCQKAFERAKAQINPKKHIGGKFNMVVENEVAARLVTPLLSALNAFSIQQNNSFLLDSLNKKVFSNGLTILDRPLDKGSCGARLFDSEGVATKNVPIIENGIVKEYFINTYMAGKMEIEPTIEDSTRACISPYCSSRAIASENFGTKELIELCKTGILVTGFNGGNSNSATGDFSYGIEGFAFKNGKIINPVKGMVITGNFITLWNKLLGAGNDARKCMSKQIPSLAFADVDFSA